MTTTQAVDCVDAVFALFATMKRSRVLDEGSRLQLGTGFGGVFWLKMKHDKYFSSRACLFPPIRRCVCRFVTFVTSHHLPPHFRCVGTVTVHRTVQIITLSAYRRSPRFCQIDNLGCRTEASAIRDVSATGRSIMSNHHTVASSLQDRLGALLLWFRLSLTSLPSRSPC